MVEDVFKENRTIQAFEPDVVQDLVFPSSAVDGFLGNFIYEFSMKFFSSI